MEEEVLRQKFLAETTIHGRIEIKRQAYQLGFTKTATEMLKNLVP